MKRTNSKQPSLFPPPTTGLWCIRCLLTTIHFIDNMTRITCNNCGWVKMDTAIGPKKRVGLP